MPTINKRFLLVLVVIAAALTGGLVAAHTVQSRRIPDALRAQAERAAEADKPDRAIHYFRHYLEFRPDDTDARERLAELIRGRPANDPRQLLSLYDQILLADPARHAVRREALKICLILRRHTDAEVHAEALLQEFPTDAGLWQQLAAAQASLQKSAEAIRSYETAIGHNPADPVPYQRLAQYLWKDQKKTAEARAVIDRLVVAMPGHPEPYVTRAKFDLAAADGTRAAADLRKALEIDPKHAEALLMTAEQYQRQRKLADAHDCLAAGMKHHPDDVRFIRSLAWLELNRGNIGSAVAVLEAGLERGRDGFELLFPLADLLVQLGETGRTAEIVSRLEARNSAPARMQVQYLKARLAMSAGEWPAAAELLQALRTDAVNMPGVENQASLLLAVCYQRQAETTLEQDTLRVLLNKDPNHLAGRVALATSYLNAGRPEDAIKEYEQVVRSPFASHQSHATLVRLKARALRRSGGGRPQDWQQLERVVGELARAANPASSEPAILRADVAEARGDLAQAASILRAEAVRRPGDARLWAALADKVADLGGASAGLGVLDEAQAAAGDGPDLRLARADLYARDPARLRAIEPLGDHIETWSDADHSRLLYGLVEIYERLGDDARLVQTYRRIAARRPSDLGVWEVLGEQATRSGDTKMAAEARAEAVKLDPSGKAAALFDAWAACTPKTPAPSGPALEGLLKAFGPNPNRADACLAMAQLKAMSGDRTEAGRLYERAVKLDPTRFPPVQRYLAHLAESGLDEETLSVLARLGRDPRWTAEPYRRAIRGAIRWTGPDAARKLLAAARAQVESEPGGLGWLGDAYLAAGFGSEAAQCYAQAVESKSASADDWLRLAVRAAERQDQAGARQAMEQAKKKLPPPLYFATAAAFAESAVAPKGWEPAIDGAKERRLFAQARLSLKLSRLDRAGAVTLLEHFLETRPDGAADVAWANRNLAMLLAVRGGAEDRKKAMAILLEAGDKTGESADEKRSSAAVLTALARHLDGENRKAVLDRATRTLEELVPETKSPRDAYLLAQLYRAGGDRPAAVKVLNQLLAADPRNVDYHLMALDELTEDRNFGAARPFAERLMTLAPGEFRVVAAVARFECKAGNPEKGLQLADGYARTADATAGDMPAKSARAAELLDELARLPTVRRTEVGKQMVKSAVDRYEALMPARPEAAVAAAGLLAIAERHADAFALIDKYGPLLPPRLKAAAGLAALRAGGANERQFARVKEWLDAAGAAETESIALKLNEGEFHALRLDYAAAERAYQWVLDRDPRNVVALNNLAWILAPDPSASKKALALVERAAAEVGLTGEILDTRARIRIAAKQFSQAEADSLEALSREKTPLRLFHLALAKDGRTPPQKEEARQAFRSAKDRGLEPRTVHPADLPAYRSLDSGMPPQGN